MAPATIAPVPPGTTLLRPALAVAAIASVAAGLVHVAAAGNHEGDTTLVWMFALCAVAQVGWGVAVALRSGPRFLLVGLVINGGAVLVWALSRTVGVPMVDALAEVERVGRQDLSAALFAGVSVLGAMRVLLRPYAPRALTYRWVGVIAAVALVSAVPALAADHEHVHAHDEEHAHDEGHAHDDAASATVHGEHDVHAVHATTTDGHAHGPVDDHTSHVLAAAHDVTHEHGDEESAAPLHDHTSAPDLTDHEHAPAGPEEPHEHPVDPTDPTGATDPTGPHTHPTDPTDPTVPTDPTDPTDLGPITSIDDPRLTQEQFDAAVELIVSTAAGMSAFATEEDILAAGYTSIGDGTEPGEYEHFVNWSYLADEFEVDPAHIESIVMKINADGTKRVVSAMYILTLGKTMTDVPDIAGELTTWHDHDNLCFDGTQLVALATDGVCPLGVLVDTPPMLHVWVEANPCGPFAAIDEHGVICDTTHTH